MTPDLDNPLAPQAPQVAPGSQPVVAMDADGSLHLLHHAGDEPLARTLTVPGDYASGTLGGYRIYCRRRFVCPDLDASPVLEVFMELP